MRVARSERIVATNESGYNTSRAGAEPHGRVDEVMPPNKPFSALPTSNQEPTLSGADWERRLAAPACKILKKCYYINNTMPEWRNGRRWGFKIP